MLKEFKFNTVFLMGLFFFSLATQAQVVATKKVNLMGCNFEITCQGISEQQAEKYTAIAIKEIQRIENLISSWDTQSETSKINKNAGIKPVVVSEELFYLIERSLLISKISDGAFDISYASMDKIWYFDKKMKNMPSPEQIKASVSKVGFKNILLNSQDKSVFLKHKGMKIGFGAIGKGYAADKTKELLKNKYKVKSGVINASGDLYAWGKQPNHKPWKIGIVNPANKQKVFSWVDITDKAIVTSGNYEKFILLDSQKYSHIIDPRTGYPAKGVKSVSIIAPSAEIADALATAVFIMGTKTGMDFIDQIPNVECIIIDDDLKIHYSKKLKTNNS